MLSVWSMANLRFIALIFGIVIVTMITVNVVRILGLKSVLLLFEAGLLLAFRPFLLL